MISAIDIVILPSDNVSGIAKSLNSQINAGKLSPEITLDRGHLPHITLVQAYIEVEKLSEIEKIVSKITEETSPFTITVSSVQTIPEGVDSFVNMIIEKTPYLTRLRQAVMDAIEPYHKTGGGDAFFGHESENITPLIINYTQGFFQNFRSAEAYFPHITIGKKYADYEPIEPISFMARQIALCHLGNWGTCRKILHEWTLV